MAASLFYLPLHPSGCPFILGVVRCSATVPAPDRLSHAQALLGQEVQAAASTGSQFTGPAFPQTPKKEFLIDPGFLEASGMGALRRNFHDPPSHSPPQSPETSIVGTSPQASVVQGRGSRCEIHVPDVKQN